MYKIVLTKTAQKDYGYLFKHNRQVFERVKKVLRIIAQDPHQGKPLKLNLKGIWSYAVGSYRILYSIERRILTVYVFDIGHRREVYR